MILFASVFLFLVALSISIVGYSLHYGISPMPSPRKAREKITALLPISEGKVYELGSGWGHLIFPLARRFPNLSLYAYEGSFVPWLVSTLLQKGLGYPNLHITRKDFFQISLKEADGIVCYLYPAAMRRLKKKLEEEGKPGLFVLSYAFSIPGWKAKKEVPLGDLLNSKVYLYVL
ncbi:MAG: hypothetical protein K940chlam9_01749 [Chlamydiae bacterium]|nr:hypothetical protein [Chlamydiota bacterium]